MKGSSIFLLIMFVLHVNSLNLQYFNNIPVDKMKLLKAQLSINKLQNDLDTNFDKPTFDANTTYVNSYLTLQNLEEIT